LDRLNRVVNDFEHSLKRLEEAIKKLEKNRKSDDYPFFRDSSIQRFKFTFEIMWKTVKTYLEREGITCRSPRSCIREFFFRRTNRRRNCSNVNENSRGQKPDSPHL